jgi:hypothetical protein
MLQTAEEAIVSRLSSEPQLSSALRISAFPETPPNDAADVRGDAVLFVRFAGLDLAAGGASRGPFVQEGVSQFELHFLIRDLRTHTKGYTLMEIAQRLLSGMRLDSDGAYSFGLPGLQMRSVNLVGWLRKSAVWHWVQSYEIPTTFEGDETL